MPPEQPRCLVVWFPGWPVTAWALAEATSTDGPIAVMVANRVVACSAAAATEGVAAGQRRREAQSRCPSLTVLAADEARDAREFEPVVECLEQLAPGVQVLRPGTCAVRARGLARYIGSEAEAAEVLLEALITTLGITTARIGIADGLFAATQAARVGDPVRIVSPGESASFLAPLPVSRLGDAELSELLPRLGIHTLGGFAALPATAVRDRFGYRGQRLHLLANGLDPAVVQPRVPPPEFARQQDFEPPLTLIDQVAFTAKAAAEEFIAALAAANLACTELRVELSGENDELVARTWLTPGMFDAAAVIDRVRWQLQAAAGGQLRSGIVRLRLEPAGVDSLAQHAPGLLATGTDERVHHVLSRVQAMLGHTGVLTAQVAGGRWLADRQALVPWGDRPEPSRPVARPWPGRVPDPQPATVFAEPRPLDVFDADGRPVTLDDRIRLSGQPAALREGGQRHRVLDWAGPWPVDDRPWDAERHRCASRFQVVDEAGTGWLLVLAGDRWWAEARYD